MERESSLCGIAKTEVRNWTDLFAAALADAGNCEQGSRWVVGGRDWKRVATTSMQSALTVEATKSEHSSGRQH